MNRRSFLKQTMLSATAVTLLKCQSPKNKTPNIILCMADDLGWGDVGFHDHPLLKTPHLDDMASHGLRFNRFYSAAPVCSPTRGSCLTGRHPYRYGIFFANVGHLKSKELTLAEMLKQHGYATGHFGKWHLGTLTRTVKDSNRGGEDNTAHYSPPWENGFDVCFSAEAKVPTWDPMIKPKNQKDHRWWNPAKPGEPAEEYGTRYWTGPEQYETENLAGDDSRIIMDRAIPFIQNAAQKDRPFFAVIWFHAPHWPVVAGKKYRDMYAGQDEFSQNHFGCITAMDEQIGRLRLELKKLDLAENTMLWFCSDNGPEGRAEAGKNEGKGSAGPFRGRKRSLYEGGIRVPGILQWPAQINKGAVTEFPACTSDYLPTIQDIFGIEPRNQPQPIDGISLYPLIKHRIAERPRPIAFESKNQLALIDTRYKLISANAGASLELYDLIKDPSETTNISNQHEDIVTTMRSQLEAWRASCSSSFGGSDY